MSEFFFGAIGGLVIFGYSVAVFVAGFRHGVRSTLDTIIERNRR